MKTFLTGGITAVPGILAAGMAAGIKKADVPDLALIVSEREATPPSEAHAKARKKVAAHFVAFRFFWLRSDPDSDLADRQRHVGHQVRENPVLFTQLLEDRF